MEQRTAPAPLPGSPRLSGLLRSCLGCLLLSVASAGHPALAEGKGERLFDPLPLAKTVRREVFDLQSAEGWRRLAAVCAELEAATHEADEALAQRQQALLQGRPVLALSAPELKAYYQAGQGQLTSRDGRVFGEIRRRAEAAAEHPAAHRTAATSEAIRELAAALGNAQRPPAPRRIADITMPWRLLKHARRGVGQGRLPASNLAAASLADSSRRDPLPSTFWERPESVEHLDLYHGFGRQNLPAYTEVVWDYAGPKTSYGGNGGLRVKSALGSGKVKFAETRSEPFATRIFWALGYHVEPTDHVPELRLRYHRRILREFNVRRDVRTTFTWLGLVPAYTLNLQRYHDPLRYIRAAVLKDGSVWDRARLRQELFLHPERARPESDPDNFRREAEDQLDYLVTVPASVTLDTRGLRSVGPWDFGQLDHADRRELRGLGLLAAWLGWYDSRFENTRLKLAPMPEGGYRLEHYLTDLGGCLGEADGFISGHEERPNAFAWICTAPPIWRGRNRMATPFRVTHFRPIALTESFARMTPDDARWMARRLGRLSETQLRQALIASGFPAAAAKLYLEKLARRRDQMIADLDLQEECAPLRRGVTRTDFDYDPAFDGPFAATLPGGRAVSAAEGAQCVRGGRLRAKAGGH